MNKKYKYLEYLPEKGIFKMRVNIAFDELDPLNLLHNSRYLYIIERCTFKFFNHLHVINAFDIVKYPDLHHVVRNVNIDYITPLYDVQDIYVYITVKRLREAGLIFYFEFRSEDEKTVYAKGTRTICKATRDTFQAIGWTKRFRETMEELIEYRKEQENNLIDL